MTTGLKTPNSYYMELITTFPPRPITNEAELIATQNRINDILDKGPLTRDDRDYLSVLGMLVYEYEEKHEPPMPEIRRTSPSLVGRIPTSTSRFSSYFRQRIYSWGSAEWRSPTRGQFLPRVSRFFPYFSIYVLGMYFCQGRDYSLILTEKTRKRRSGAFAPGKH